MAAETPTQFADEISPEDDLFDISNENSSSSSYNQQKSAWAIQPLVVTSGISCLFGLGLAVNVAVCWLTSSRWRRRRTGSASQARILDFRRAGATLIGQSAAGVTSCLVGVALALLAGILQHAESLPEVICRSISGLPHLVLASTCALFVVTSANQYALYNHPGIRGSNRDVIDGTTFYSTSVRLVAPLVVGLASAGLVVALPGIATTTATPASDFRTDYEFDFVQCACARSSVVTENGDDWQIGGILTAVYCVTSLACIAFLVALRLRGGNSSSSSCDAMGDGKPLTSAAALAANANGKELVGLRRSSPGDNNALSGGERWLSVDANSAYVSSSDRLAVAQSSSSCNPARPSSTPGSTSVSSNLHRSTASIRSAAQKSDSKRRGSSQPQAAGSGGGDGHHQYDFIDNDDVDDADNNDDVGVNDCGSRRDDVIGHVGGADKPEDDSCDTRMRRLFARKRAGEYLRRSLREVFDYYRLELWT